MAVEINGDGLITVDGTSTTQGRVRLKEDADNGSNYVELTAPASVTANRTITFPDATGTVNTSGAVNEVPAGTVSAPSIYPTGDTNTGIFFPAADTIAFAEGGVESARFDSSGRLLLGTSTARENFFNTTISPGFQQEAASNNSSLSGRFMSLTFGSATGAGPIYVLAKHRSNSVGGTTVVQSGDEFGQIVFQGSDGTDFVEGAGIRAEVDGTPGANDMPGRLIFSTTADGASTATERMRIDSAGRFIVASLGYQPRFLAYRSGDQTGYNATSTGDAVVIYNATSQNIGSHYSTTTGKFTAPIAGMYAFQASAWSSGGTAFTQIWLVVNGARANYTDLVYSANNMVGATWIIYLNANDSIGIHPYNGTNNNQTITDNAYHTWFKGYLVN